MSKFNYNYGIKDLSKYNNEMIGNVLFQLKENGNSMRKERMDDFIYETYNRMLKGALNNCQPMFMYKLEEVYKEAERRGWIVRGKNTISITDKGLLADSEGVSKRKLVDVDHDSTEELLYRQAEKEEKKEKIIRIVAGCIILLLLLLTVIGILPLKELAEYIISILF